MADNLPELSGAASLGDIDDILHNESVSDLSWLDVDVADYRAHETLPKQNLDWIPEVSRALTEDDRDPRVPMRIPLRRHTIVNSNPLERPSPPVRSSLSSIQDRAVAYVMAGMKPDAVRLKLSSEFGPGDLSFAENDVATIIDESGVLGNVYIPSQNFPRCAQDGAHRAFISKYGERALFVLAKSECVGCVHNASGRCATMDKRIVGSVPYDEKTYAHYLPRLLSERRASVKDAHSVGMNDSERKKSLCDAFNRKIISSRQDPIQTIQHHPKQSKIEATEDEIRSFWSRKSADKDAEPLPSAIYLMAARRIMLGTADARSLIASSDSEVRKLAFEHGILGYTYLDADALGGPRATMDLISSHSLSPDFLLMRNTYSDIRDTEALTHISSIIVRKRPEIGKRLFLNACNRAVNEGRMTVDQAESASLAKDGSPWARLVSQANLYSVPATVIASDVPSAPSGSFYYGDTSTSLESKMDSTEVHNAISHMMNTGLCGKSLKNAILARYTRSDLQQVSEVGRILSCDDGVQGTYFIDPSIYRDYGKGCSRGSQLFRKQGAERVLAGLSCTGCMHQNAPSWCSKYSKQIIRKVPEKQRKIAAERRRAPLLQSDTAPINNPVDEFGLESSLHVDVATSTCQSVDISFEVSDVSI